MTCIDYYYYGTTITLNNQQFIILSTFYKHI